MKLIGLERVTKERNTNIQIDNQLLVTKQARENKCSDNVDWLLKKWVTTSMNTCQFAITPAVHLAKASMPY